MAFYFQNWYARSYPYIVVLSVMVVAWLFFCPLGHNRWTDALGGAFLGVLIGALMVRPNRIMKPSPTED